MTAKVNLFEKHPGQVLIILSMEDGSTDCAPMGAPGADTLIQASMLAMQYSLQVGVKDVTIWNSITEAGKTDEELVSKFVNGRFDQSIDTPNPYAGML